MRKLVPIKEIYTRQFGQLEPILNIPFMAYAKELADSRTELQESGYYKWLKTNLDKHGHVWKSLHTEEDLLERTRKFKEIIRSIKNGYSEEKEDKLRVIDGKIYGGLTAYEEDGKYILIDGSHRISAMNALSIKFCHLLICENNPIPSKPE